MLKFDGALRTDAPAVSTTGATGHIVQEHPLCPSVFIIQCARRTVLHTSQTSVTLVIDLKVSHFCFESLPPIRSQTKSQRSSHPDLGSLDKALGNTLYGGSRHFRRLHIRKRLRFTAAHTLRVTSTEVTLKGTPTIAVKTHGPEGTGCDAHLAADAAGVSDQYPVITVPVDGVNRACRSTGRIRALKADDGEIKSVYRLVRDDTNATECRVVPTCALQGASCFAFPAAIALQWIEKKEFIRHERFSNISPRR